MRIAPAPLSQRNVVVRALGMPSVMSGTIMPSSAQATLLHTDANKRFSVKSKRIFAKFALNIFGKCLAQRFSCIKGC
jgi:hypothetical protein